MLLMSGYTADVVDLTSALDGQVGLLEKPFSQESLGAKVREALNQPTP